MKVQTINEKRLKEGWSNRNELFEKRYGSIYINIRTKLRYKKNDWKGL